ncbi:hypothetical protein Pcinc_030978 [Petrolisthes cinctipes]|uniref:Uncharacterized protein n=1 Tax=Petrolisthes cinctipes TaxID=88211 RepID=A0AAE1EXK6_PETCI|nr:hypothetical protein Pcinc_030978 [Petrolisthes cinctipes]
MQPSSPLPLTVLMGPVTASHIPPSLHSPYHSPTVVTLLHPSALLFPRLPTSSQPSPFFTFHPLSVSCLTSVSHLGPSRLLGHWKVISVSRKSYCLNRNKITEALTVKPLSYLAVLFPSQSTPRPPPCNP